MSTTPGSRPSSLTIVGWLVAAVIAIGVVVLVALNASAIWNSFFPPAAEERPGRRTSATSTTSSSASPS